MTRRTKTNMALFPQESRLETIRLVNIQHAVFLLIHLRLQDPSHTPPFRRRRRSREKKKEKKSPLAAAIVWHVGIAGVYL